MRNKNAKAIAAILSFALIFSAARAFADQTKTSDKQKEKKVLRWAADTESGAPYVFSDPDNFQNLIGFEADIIKEIAKELGMKEKHVQIQWDGLIPGLERKDYDVAINGIEITADRKRVVNFSKPYYLTYEQLVVRKEEDRINNLSDLVGKKVGTLKACLAERLLRAAGGIQVLTYDSEKNSFTDLELGRLDAVLIDYPVALYYASWNPQLKLTGQPIGEIIYGIAMRKSDTLLLKRINAALDNIIKSGRLREILEYWNMWNFMMAKYLDDHKASNVPHTGYNNYINSLMRKPTFRELLKRYVSFLPSLGQAALVTVALSIIAMILAILLGLVLAVMRVYGPPFISILAKSYIELIRGTPLLIQLYFIYYAFPEIGIQLSPFFAAILGLGLNYAAYEAENYRAGIQSVPKGQMEAAISLGMKKRQALRYVILPQAVRVVIPPVTNDFISLLKDSSLVSIIAMVELTKTYFKLAATYYDYIGTGILVAAIYLIIGLPFVRLSKIAEKKFGGGLKQEKA